MSVVTADPAWVARLRAGLGRLGDPPSDPPCNRAEIDDLLAPGQAPRPAAVLVPIRLVGMEASVLLTRRAEALAHHSGQISFPGGRIEDDDDGPAAAALREAQEEIGLPPQSVRLLGYLPARLTITGFRVQPVVGLVAPGFRPHIDSREVAEAFEVPLRFLLETGNARQIRARYRGRMRSWHEFRYQDRQIWGATAAIILDLRTCLTGECP